MAVLLLAEVSNGKLNEATAKALTAAKALDEPVHVLVAGERVEAAARAAASLDGIEKVLVADDPVYAHQLAEPLAALLVQLAGNYSAILAAATSTGKNVMPRVAALLDVMQISEIIKVAAPETFDRPIYAGNAIETVQSADTKKIITVRTAAFPATGEGGSAPLEKIATAAAGRELTRFGTGHLLFTRLGRTYEEALEAATISLSQRYAMDFRRAAERYAALGPPERVAQSIRAFHAAGVRHVLLDIVGPYEDRHDQIRWIAQDLLPLLAELR